MLENNLLTNEHCLACGKKIDRPRKFRLQKFAYCSIVCRTQGDKERRVALFGPVLPISTGSIGAIGELLASADLVKSLFHVYRSVSPNAPCDLIAQRGKLLLRVQVTVARRSAKTGKVSFAPHDESDYDLLALVFLSNNSVEYIPPLSSFDGKR